MCSESVEVKYYSNRRPVSRLELDMILFGLSDDYTVECKDMSYRGESRVYLVAVNHDSRKVVVGVKE